MSLLEVPVGRAAAHVRHVFDQALAQVHYAGSCQRVGRCMRIAIMSGGEWCGGIVLGSTFPNVHVRDQVLGLKPFVSDTGRHGLRSPWASENRAYWSRLQLVVNHARTFVFPSHQGQGLGIAAHRLLLTDGVGLWTRRYGQPVAAFDTLCDDADSGLFRRNGWLLAGLTSGYESDPHSRFAGKDSPAADSIRNNVALRPGPRRWVVWVRLVDADAFQRI